MTPRALVLTALFALTPLASGGIAHAQTAQGPAKEKPRAAAEPDDKSAAPTIRIHRAKATADGKIGEVCIVAEGGGDAVPKVILTMDSVPVAPRRSASAGAAEGNECPTPWDYRVQLVPGMHHLEAAVYANNSDTPAAVARDSILGRADSAAMATTLHILTVGINRYPPGVDSLSYARTDARAFADSLGRQAAPLFGSVRIKSLYDGAATKDSIILALMAIDSLVKPNDTFVFFFAGHGAMEDGHMFLAAAEVSSLTDKRKLTLKGIRDDELLNYMGDIDGNTLMVLDACHSGQMITAFRYKDSRASAIYRLQGQSAPNLAILAATDSAGLAEENGRLRHGLFTAALLHGRTPGQALNIRKTAYLNEAAGKFLNDWYVENSQPRDETHIWKPPTRDFNLVIR